MKKIKLVLLVLFSSSVVFSQTDTFIIKVIDARNQVDSVIMGYRDNATTGVDESLGESDYYGNPFSDLDIRSIQRNTITKDSFWLSSLNSGNAVLPFLKNFDLKKDFRKFALIEHFIVQVHAKNYPVTIKLVYFNLGQHTSYYS